MFGISCFVIIASNLPSYAQSRVHDFSIDEISGKDGNIVYGDIINGNIVKWGN